jgi:hypothetical protein
VKRAALILLTFIYVLSCTGMAVNSFYCCGKLASVKLEYGAADNALTQIKKNGKGCCRHELLNLKVKDNHFTPAVFSISKPVAIALPLFGFTVQPVVIALRTINSCYKGNAPPGLADNPIYTLHCAYRI